MRKTSFVFSALCVSLLIFLTACTDSTNMDQILSSQAAAESAVTTVTTTAANTAAALLPPETSLSVSESTQAPASSQKKLILGTTSVPPVETGTSTSASEEKIDVDLTAMSTTMVYSEVFNMMTAPENYVGKTVRVQGPYNSFTDEETSKRYFFVLIKDATACCQQGMEFIWDDGKHVYPDEYPAENSQVQITGLFGVYQDGAAVYCYLAVDDITLL